MKILVTGGSGFIGRPLVSTLATEHEIWIAGRQPVPDLPPQRFVKWDLADPLADGHLPASLDAVVHLAQSRDYRRFPERAVAVTRVNLGATLELLDHARQAGAKTFVLASSGGVYGGADHPIKEDERLCAPDFYLATKLAQETIAAAFRETFDVITLRLFFVYGRGQAPDRFLAGLVNRVLSGEPVVLYGHNGITINPTHVSDVVTAIGRSLGLKGSHAINVAGPETLTLRRLTEMIASHVGQQPVFEELPPDPSRDLVADIHLMQRLLGAPQRTVADSIGDVCEEIMSAAR